MEKYCIYFAQTHPNFRHEELISVSELLSIPIEILEPISEKSPFLIVGLSSVSHARLLAERCILIKEIIRVWVSADTKEELLLELQTDSVMKSIPDSFYTETFKMMIKTWRRSTSLSEQREIITSFGKYLDFKGIPLHNSNFQRKGRSKESYQCSSVFRRVE
jgi:tRNA (guanine10-N2)-methyltransferase